MDKKNFLKSALAVCIIALAGCSKSEELTSAEETVDSGKVISFRTVTNKTRATAQDGENIKDFTVFANYYDNDATNFALMAGINVTRGFNDGATDNGTKWSYAPAKYWPIDGETVDFLAFSPAGSRNVTQLTAVSKKPSETRYTEFTIGYTVPLKETDILTSAADKEPEDFLIASNSIAKASQTTSAVQLTFWHALSMVRFQVKNENTSVVYTIEKLELCNFANSATYTGKVYEAKPAGEITTKTPGTMDKTYIANLPANGVSVPHTADYVDLLPANQGLMLLPQTGTSAAEPGRKVYINTNSDLAATPTYDAEKSTYESNNGTGKYYLKVTFGAKDGVEDVVYPAHSVKFCPLPDTFDMGYIYTLRLAFSHLNAISFDVAVDAWDAKTPNDLN